MTLDAIRRVSEVAEGQWGMVTTKQAAAAGVSRAQLARFDQAGVLERVTQGVYRAVAAPMHEHWEILANWLALGGTLPSSGIPDLVVGGTTAARLYGIGDFFLTDIDFISPTHRRTRRPNVRLRQAQLKEHEVRQASQGIPALTPARTIADLVEQVGDLSLVGDALHDARTHGLIDESRLLAHLNSIAPATGHTDGSTLLTLLESGNRVRV